MLFEGKTQKNQVNFKQDRKTTVQLRIFKKYTEVQTHTQERERDYQEIRNFVSPG